MKPKVLKVALQHRIDQWAKAKLALDANRPDFTPKQLRDLQAQEAILLALSSLPVESTDDRCDDEVTGGGATTGCATKANHD